MVDVTTATERPPLGFRLLQALRREPDWSAMPAEELLAFREAENRKRASRLLRVITGLPARGAAIRWQEVTLPDRRLRVRVHRPPAGGRQLPLVLHVHGGAFVGTAAQSDWINSHLAAQLPALVVSVEHRLLDAQTPLAAAVDDGWDVLRHVLQHGAEWGIDPARTAVFGESCGALISALAAIRARDADLHLQAQVLVNPAVDATDTMLDYASVAEYARTPTLAVPQLQLFQRLAVPPGTDPRAISPLHADNLNGLPPALVVVPTVDALADHGRRYAERLLESGTPTRLTEHRGAPHGFLSLPGVVPQAKAARAEIVEFLRGHLVA